MENRNASDSRNINIWAKISIFNHKWWILWMSLRCSRFDDHFKWWYKDPLQLIRSQIIRQYPYWFFGGKMRGSLNSFTVTERNDSSSNPLHKTEIEFGRDDIFSPRVWHFQTIFTNIINKIALFWRHYIMKASLLKWLILERDQRRQKEEKRERFNSPWSFS